MTGCSSDDDNNTVTVQEGEPTTLRLSIQQPKSYTTDNNATENELKINTVDVIFFDGNSKTFIGRESYTLSEIKIKGDNEYYIEGIPTTTGPKEIFVGINIPAELFVGYYKGVAKGSSLDAVQNVTAELLANETNGIAMFSEVAAEADLVRADNIDYPNKNDLKINVLRLVSKVTVQKGNDLDLDEKVEGGKIIDLKFATRNVNRLLFAIQNKNGNIIEDPNWIDGSYRAEDFYRNDKQYYDSEYVDVNEYNTAVKQLNTKYVTENTSQMHYQWETTYASIRAEFIPEKFSDADGVLSDNTNPAASTFYTLMLEDGSTLYFEDLITANQYITNQGLNPDDYEPSEYKNGYCYYNMFLNPSDSDNEFGTIRNAFYKTSITRIYGLGNPNPWDGGDEEIPVTTTTHIDVEVLPVPWSVVSDEYELN